jgi:mono/diheme cytochrome c family protein
MRVTVFPLLFAALIPAAQAQAPDGRAVFNEQCAACHQPDAKGLPGNFPPLAGNPDLFLARDFPVRVVLFGMTGTIEVLGQTIDGVMPPVGENLDDAQVAAVVNFVRGNFGNAALAPKPVAPVDAALVADLRRQHATLGEAVHSYREQLKAAADKK